jgi:hypothetical protein
MKRSAFIHEVAERVMRMDPINKHLFLYTCFLLQHRDNKLAAQDQIEP